MCEEEQALQMTQELPTIEQYLRRRMGSSGVEVCLAIQEYDSITSVFESLANLACIGTALV